MAGFFKFTPLQWVVHVGAWIPLGYLVWAFYTDRLTVNPIQSATQHTGIFALSLLVLSLACTPINTIFGFHQALKVRRALGLYAFIYAAIHFTIFIWLDYGLDWQLLRVDVFNKPYILVGLSALIILLLLAITSFKFWMKYLGKNWARLHRLVYLVAGLVIMHFAWAVKGNLLQLKGNISQVFLYGLVVAILLILRIPIIRHTLSMARFKIRKSNTSMMPPPPEEKREI